MRAGREKTEGFRFLIPGRRGSAGPGIQMQALSQFWIPGSLVTVAPLSDDHAGATKKLRGRE
jgi:hypothetical protein